MSDQASNVTRRRHAVWPLDPRFERIEFVDPDGQTSHVRYELRWATLPGAEPSPTPLSITRLNTIALCLNLILTLILVRSLP